MAALLNVVLPVFLVAGIALLAQRRLQLELRTLTQLAFYVFSPALIFDSLVNSDVSGAEFGRITALLLVITGLSWAAGELAARLLHLHGPTKGSFLVSLVLINAGNYGLPTLLFAYGEAGVTRGALYLIVSSTLSASLGVYLAARGRLTAREALRRAAQVPLLYAAALGLLLKFTGLHLPDPAIKAIHLLGEGATPSFLVILGLQLDQALRTGFRPAHLPALTFLTVGRLLLAPLLAWALAPAFGLTGLTRNVFVVETAMPTAVMATILATEFDADPPFAALAILATTVASLVTLTGWLTAL